MPPQQWTALRKITECRTPALGGKVHACADCGHEHKHYHSCNHRLCPQCGALEAHEWCERQSEHLLPDVTYFMVTPTLPGVLRPFAKSDEKRWYDWFFEATSSAMSDLMADPKGEHGGQAGFFGVLQTWRRDLGYHPHIHYIVPSGVLIEEARKVPGQRKRQMHRRWKPGPFRKSSGPYLLNAYALQRAIRIRMEALVKKHAPEVYAKISWKVWREQSWRCDVKPVGSGLRAVRYLARYVSKSAISNPQLRSHYGGRVTYSYTPNDGNNRSKQRTVEAHEFMREVLQHALPKGFKRVRYFGWQHPSAKTRGEHVKLLLGKPLNYQQKSTEPKATKLSCRACQSQRVKPTRELTPLRGLLKELWIWQQFGETRRVLIKTEEGSPKQHGSRAPPQSKPAVFAAEGSKPSA